jgi:hypothetical protein
VTTRLELETEILQLESEITAFADRYGWNAAREMIRELLARKIGPCARCGRETDEYNEEERRFVHTVCIAE